MQDDIQALQVLENLTVKQVEVLELLAMHRTTKEIARELGIAPNTVDQRINAVRDKWGTVNRKDTARRYAELVERCGKTPCDFSRIDVDGNGADEHDQDLPVDPVFVLSDVSLMGRGADWFEGMDAGSRGLGAFDKKFGRIGRVAAILVLAFIMAMTLASSLAIAEVLGRMI